MKVGVCIGMPGTAEGPSVEYLARYKALTGVEMIRFDWHVQNPHGMQMFRSCLEAGLAPWPILDGHVHRDPPNVSPAVYGARCGEIAALLSDRPGQIFELWNEAKVMTRLTPQQYAEYVRAAVYEIRTYHPSARLVLCGDVYSPGGDGKLEYFGPELIAGWVPPWLRRPWFATLLDALGSTYDLIDAVGVHWYRNPLPPEYSGFGSRAQELVVYRVEVRDKLIFITEMGWDNESRELRRDYVMRELDICEAAGIEHVFIFTYRGAEWGVLDEHDNPTLLSEALLARSSAQREETHT